MGLLGVQWWQHQSNQNSAKNRAPFSFYGSLATVRGLLCRLLEKCKSPGTFWAFLRVMEESRVFLGSSDGSIRVKGILPKLRHLFSSMEVLPQLWDFFVALREM